MVYLSGIRTFLNTRGRYQPQLNNTSINSNVLNVKNTNRINISQMILPGVKNDARYSIR